MRAQAKDKNSGEIHRIVQFMNSHRASHSQEMQFQQLKNCRISLFAVEGFLVNRVSHKMG